MSTLDTLYNSSATKSFVVSNSSGDIFLISQKLDNSWYLAKALLQVTVGYSADSSFAIIKGDQAIWSTL